MINIQLYSSQGKSGGTFQTNGTKLADIMPQINAAGIDINNMRLVVGETEHELLTPDSTLPTHDFTLFFYQVKNKGGAKPGYTRSDVYAARTALISSGKATEGDFIIDGKNFTMVGSDKLVQAMLSKVSADELAKVLPGFVPVSESVSKEKAPAKVAKPKKAASKELVPIINGLVETNDPKSQLDSIIRKMAGISVPDHHQEGFNKASDILTHIVTNWETKKASPTELADKFRKIGSKMRNVNY